MNGVHGILIRCCLLLATGAGTVAAQGVRIVDLTQPISEGMPFWPGGVPFKMERLVDYDQGYRLHSFTMGENTGTHVDAPSHFVEGGRGIDKLGVEDLVVPLAVIDARRQAGTDADYLLQAEDILAWEEEHGQIREQTFVVLNTGWHSRFAVPKDYLNQDPGGTMHFPGYSAEAARLLVAREVAGIGIDTLSIDYGGSGDFAAHRVMLRAGKYQVENIANLDILPPTGATVIIGVLPVRNGTQAPARIFALLPGTAAPQGGDGQE